MKKILALLFVLVLCFACLTVVACNPGHSTKTDATQSSIEKAMAFVHELYKSDSKDKPTVDTGDYDLITNVPISGENFSVSWKIEKVNASDLNVAEIFTDEKDGKLKVRIKYEAGYNNVATDYKLIATVTNGTDTQTRTYNRQVPAFVYTTYTEWLQNCEKKSTTVMNIKAYVIGIVSTSSGSAGSMYLQDAEGHGYYVYNPTLSAADKANDTALRAAYPVGCEVIVSGTGTVYGGQYEFNKEATVKKTGNSITADQLKTLDASAAFAAAADSQSTSLIPYQNTLVTLKNCTLTSINGQYYYFTIGDKKIQFNIFDNTYFVSDADRTAWKANFKSGSTATITGIVSCFSNVYQIYPVSADVISDLQAPTSKTEVVKGTLDPFGNDTILVKTGSINLPTAGSGDTASVTIEWKLDNTYDFIKVENGVLTITSIPATATTVKLTAVIKAEGDANAEKEFTLIIREAYTAPAVDTAFVMAVDQNNAKVNKTLYFNGAMSGNFLGTTENMAEAVEVKIEAVEGGYRIYFMEGDTKKYIDIIPRTGSAGKVNVTISTTPNATFVFDQVLGVFTANVEGKTWYLGTYNDFTTLSASETYRISGSNASNVGKSQFVCYFTTKTITDDMFVNAEKEKLTIATTVSAAGEVELPTTGTTYHDVTIKWAYEGTDTYAVISEDGTKVTYTLPTEADVTITLVATIKYGTASTTKAFNITLKKAGSASETPAGNYYEKVTAAPADWSGTYLIVYEVGEQAHVYNGTDNKGAGSEGATIKNGQIMSTTEIAKFQVTIEKTDNGYSVKLASGKYISGKKDKNGISFPDTAADCTITYDAASNSVLITSNTSVLRYNANNGEERFRFYKSTTYTQQKAIQLYKLVEV